ncbi:unnamed protein product [Lota lota]
MLRAAGYKPQQDLVLRKPASPGALTPRPQGPAPWLNQRTGSELVMRRRGDMGIILHGPNGGCHSQLAGPPSDLQQVERLVIVQPWCPDPPTPGPCPVAEPEDGVRVGDEEERRHGDYPPRTYPANQALISLKASLFRLS